MNDFVAGSLMKTPRHSRSTYYAEWDAQFEKKVNGDQQLAGDDETTSSMREDQTPSNVPAKIKIFTWRPVHGSLP